MGADTAGRPVTVAVVEDTDVVMEGVQSWIERDPDRRAVIVASGESIDAVVNGSTVADVIVLDLELNGTMVTDQVGRLSDAGHRIVVYSVHVEPLIVERVLAAGACAFLDKRTERSHFVDTIVAVAKDQPFVTQSMAGGMLRHVRLSNREREALLLLFQGMSFGSIASRLTRHDQTGKPLSPETVKQYVQRARAKIAATGRPCRSNFALLARCMELGLVRPAEIEDYRSSAAGPGALSR